MMVNNGGMEYASGVAQIPIRVEVPANFHHKALISCQVACPVHTDARGYVRAIAAGDFERAYLIARGPNPFASICGRICGAPCELSCRRGKIPRTDDDGSFVAIDRPIAIRALKRFVCESHGAEARPAGEILEALRGHMPAVAGDAEEMAFLLRAALQGTFVRANGEQVAIIGSGPAGLSAAHDLALLGFKPVVFELEPVAAGMLAVGVPEYRLPRELIRREVSVIEALGVEIRCNKKIGREVSFQSLRAGFAAVIIAVGAKRPRALGLPGEQGPGVFGGVDFLRAVALGESLPLGSNVIVIGGGNVAYDVARTVVRQSAYDAARTAARLPGTRQVRLASLETLEEMPADTVEIREGDEEGIERLSGWGPVAIQRDDRGSVIGLEIKRCLRVYDEQRRFSPKFDDDDRQVLKCDTVLIAAGQAPDLAFLEQGGSDVEQFRPGWPKVDAATLASSAKGVFVAGDLAYGPRLLIDAVASGKKAARSVYQYVTGRTLHPETLMSFVQLDRYYRERGYELIRRVELPSLEPEERLKDPKASVEKRLSQQEAMREASRCLDCGVTPVFDGSRCILCGGCADVCPTQCLKIVPLSFLDPTPDVTRLAAAQLGAGADRDEHSAILKDEDRCIRCALCVHRCPADAIAMERVSFQTEWRNV
ncbi:MAG TPA: FAD-dependent oxidoreductase [Candidatus Binatia bacterium]|jgi:NADPH-dependent glutamate synthase beta subunit-like oxidoreductase